MHTRILVSAVVVGFIAIVALMPMATTQALFVAVARNTGNLFGVPSNLTASGVNATPLPGGRIKVIWREPDERTPVATSWAGAYAIYRSQSPATPNAEAVPYATVLSNASGAGEFIDGPAQASCTTGSICTVNNVRYYYWVRAFSRQTSFGSPLLSPYTSGASDATPPIIVGTSPANGMVGVPLRTNIQVTFNEPVDFPTAVAAVCVAPASAPGACVPLTGNQDRWVKSVGSLLELRLPIDTSLSAGTAYTVSFTSNETVFVRDIAGNKMDVAPQAWTFTTETPAATVTFRWRSPAVDGQEYMPASGGVVTIAFAEPMNRSAVANAFGLYGGVGCAGAPLSVTATWNATNNAVAFAPNVPLATGLLGSPTFGVHQYSMRFNEPLVTQGLASSGNGAGSIACANGTFVPTSSVLAFTLADAVGPPTSDPPRVVAGETIWLRSVSGPWRQGSYTSLRARFDEPKATGAVVSNVAISGDTWTALPITVPADSANGLHYLSVENDAIASGIGQDARTAVRAVTVEEPTVTVTALDLSDPTEGTVRTILSPLAATDTVGIRVRVTAPTRDGTGVRAVGGIPINARILLNPSTYGASICGNRTQGECSGRVTTLTGTTDNDGYARFFLTAPVQGAPFNTIVVLASAGTGWGSVLLTDPAPVPPANLTHDNVSETFAWTASPSRGVAGYRVIVADLDNTVAPNVVIDAGNLVTVGTPKGALAHGVAYRAVVVAYDASGRTSATSAPISFIAPVATSTPTPTPTPTAVASATPTTGASATFAVGLTTFTPTAQSLSPSPTSTPRTPAVGVGATITATTTAGTPPALATSNLSSPTVGAGQGAGSTSTPTTIASIQPTAISPDGSPTTTVVVATPTALSPLTTTTTTPVPTTTGDTTTPLPTTTGATTTPVPTTTGPTTTPVPTATGATTTPVPTTTGATTTPVPTTTGPTTTPVPTATGATSTIATVATGPVIIGPTTAVPAIAPTAVATPVPGSAQLDRVGSGADL